MTRFARAKGSKASNEKLPEPATSWSEMKQGLLMKSKELAEKKDREVALNRRQANYQAFLQEKEEAEEKKIAWADFPEVTKLGGNEKVNRKRKAHNSINKQVKNVNSELTNRDDKSDDSDGQFAALKKQIDKVLAEESGHGSDSDDAPPEELSTKVTLPEIVIKKPKRPIQKLKIVTKKEELLIKEAEGGVEKKIPQNESKDKILTEKEKKLIAKKYDRHRKQMEKKKLMGKKSTLSASDSLAIPSEIPDNSQETNQIEKSATDKKLERRRKQKEKKKLHKKLAVNEDAEASVKEEITSENGSLKISKSGDSEKSRTQKQIEKRKRQKEKKKLKQEQGLNTVVVKSTENLSEEDLKKIQRRKEKTARQAEKRRKFREVQAAEKAEAMKNEHSTTENSDAKKSFIDHSLNNINNKLKTNLERNQNSRNSNEQEQNSVNRKPFQKLLNNQNQKKTKHKDGKERPNQKQRPEKMFINGKTVEIDYIEGFPVKKEDADRLKKLRKEMISKGLPRSEINAALKLERRRAEKALAREKKNVCFNCRKSGHNLSECPDLNKDQVAQSSGTGICFKCGSTEHTHFECKVVKGLDYKFASCFICGEQGHIARQCPDNQRGLYPKGGSCKVCGDVTHLKKDCPKYQAQQAQLQSSVSIDTIDYGNPDDLNSSGHRNSFSEVGKKPNNKVIKF